MAEKQQLNYVENSTQIKSMAKRLPFIEFLIFFHTKPLMWVGEADIGVVFMIVNAVDVDVGV